jgi:hypothetical protein
LSVEHHALLFFQLDLELKNRCGGVTFTAKLIAPRSEWVGCKASVNLLLVVTYNATATVRPEFSKAKMHNMHTIQVVRE